MLRKLLLILVGGLFSLIVLLGAVWMGLNWYGDQAIANQEEVGFVIEPGESLGKVTEKLNDAGVIQYPEVFQVLARLDNVATALKAGDYLIKLGLSRRELLAVFVEGRVRYYSITLVEGRTLKDVLTELNEHEKLTNPLSLSDVVNIVDTLEKGDNPEGFFYPDTYSFEAGASVESILRIAHDRLEAVLAEEWSQRQKDLPYNSPYEALIMASIIEKETGAPFERPDIAGVFVRRMNKGMRLQTDPTVIYGLGDRYEGKLNRRMLREYTSYNTYVIKGLPPTPIALVGREAINAALNPSSGKALYFVARGDGTHYFSDTLSEHNKAVRKYQIVERREDYRSTVQ
ncbi:hypothetical protein ACH42_13460 [Endozoicomonas sp. (ex Bugula neritina AB1)]|nr:hypothetical protein ACH42_13460 [Endozoicomonas sp. (ex Bugula neritina AB1)]